jgi:ATP-dependent DNA ligase
LSGPKIPRLDGSCGSIQRTWERRRLLDSLALHGSYWQKSAVFDDGEALLQVAQERGLEGVVAKRWTYRGEERAG